MVFKSSVKALILVLTIGLLVETTSCVLAVEGDTKLNHTVSNGIDPESENGRKSTKRSLEGAQTISAKRPKTQVEFLNEFVEQGNVEQIESDAGAEKVNNRDMGIDIASYFDSDENVKAFLGLITSYGELDGQPQESEEYGESWIEGYFESDENVRAFLEVEEGGEKNIVETVGNTNVAGLFVCERCNYEACHRRDLWHHKKIHKREKYKCDYEGCEYVSSDKWSLEKHKRRHTGEKPYKCEYEGCEYASSRKGDLEKHKRRHTGERPFKCEYEGCEYASSRKKEMEIHKIKHLGEKEKPYKCEYERCEYASSRKGDLEKHKIKHTEEKSYKCEHEGCEYASSRKGDLEKHKRRHTGERPYKCEYEGCGYAASYRSALDNHKRRHTGERFKCKYEGCDYGATQKGSLKRHKKSIHRREAI